MAAVSNYDVITEFQLRQSMRVYLKNNRAKFYHDPIWNNGAYSKWSSQQKEQEEEKQQQQDEQRYEISSLSNNL